MKELTYNEKFGLIKQLVPCSFCKTVDDIEISHELLNHQFVVWCGCGKGTNSHDTLQDALNAWSAKNQ